MFVPSRASCYLCLIKLTSYGICIPFLLDHNYLEVFIFALNYNFDLYRIEVQTARTAPWEPSWWLKKLIFLIPLSLQGKQGKRTNKLVWLSDASLVGQHVAEWHIVQKKSMRRNLCFSLKLCRTLFMCDCALIGSFFYALALV
ncbi:hypothetical protein D1007_07233 [Hordeum vulgare]|nr:hypothetical protein D1007_07233 [Hordeum vulgare]